MLKKHIMITMVVLASFLTSVTSHAAGLLGSSILTNTQFSPGDYLQSSNGEFMAVWQSNDGNFVVYKMPGYGFRWASFTENKGANSCWFQGDGNFVIYRESTIFVDVPYGTEWQWVWNEYDQQYNWEEVVLYQQEPVNIMTALWNSHTEGNPGATMVMQDDGNLVIYGAAGNALWHIGAYYTNPPPVTPPPAPQGHIDLPASISAITNGNQITLSFSIDDGGIVQSQLVLNQYIAHAWCNFSSDPNWLTFQVSNLRNGRGYVFWTLRDNFGNPNGALQRHDEHMFAAFYKRSTRSWTIVKLATYRGGGVSTIDHYFYDFSNITLNLQSINWQVVKHDYQSHSWSSTPTYSIPAQTL